MKDSVCTYSVELSSLYRLEYSRMTAVICRHFGLQHIAKAEDIASDTFLKAAASWQQNGIPDKPTAWLFAVAKNLAKDQLKRETIFNKKVRNAITNDELTFEQALDFTPKSILDSELAMIFAVCNPLNSQETQICLALQILCGFSLQEIADAFLTSVETIKKRLSRGRNNLRNDNFTISQLSENNIRERLSVVLNTLYLLFNEGYYSKSNDRTIRKDLCTAAIRLTLTLTKNSETDTAETNALLALMCFQSSRFDARTNAEGDVILFDQQDQGLWNKELINEGNFYLVNSCSGNEISRYHLEAGIAYWHTVPGNQDKWQKILPLYNELVIMIYSPVTALNRTFAVAKVYGEKEAIKEAEKLSSLNSSEYFALMGYLHKDLDIDKALAYYRKAVELARSNFEKKSLKKELERLMDIQKSGSVDKGLIPK